MSALILDLRGIAIQPGMVREWLIAGKTSVGGGLALITLAGGAFLRMKEAHLQIT